MPIMCSELEGGLSIFPLFILKWCDLHKRDSHNYLRRLEQNLKLMKNILIDYIQYLQ